MRVLEKKNINHFLSPTASISRKETLHDTHIPDSLSLSLGFIIIARVTHHATTHITNRGLYAPKRVVQTKNTHKHVSLGP